MIKKILLGIVVIIILAVAALAIGIARQPDEYMVTRSTTVAAPAEAVFMQVNNFHNWDAWSPWAKLDPNMKTEYSGPPLGKSSQYSWTGNDQVGEGKMTIADSTEPSDVKIKLDFIKPFASSSDTMFTFKPDGAGTNVTWTMQGKHNIMSKAMCLFMDMDKMIGPDFEKGLAQLKKVAESTPPPIVN